MPVYLIPETATATKPADDYFSDRPYTAAESHAKRKHGKEATVTRHGPKYEDDPTKHQQYQAFINHVAVGDPFTVTPRD